MANLWCFKSVNVSINLLVITLWLLSKNVNWLVAFIPMVFMMVMSLWGRCSGYRTAVEL